MTRSIWISRRSFLKLFTSLAFVFFTLLLCPFLNAYALEIPSEHGRIENKLPGENGKTLVLIQEAHADYNGQLAILKILKSLVDQNALRLILVEGGFGDVNLSHLQKYGAPKSRKTLAEKLLKEGELTAEEYLSVTSHQDLILWGIDDPKTYEENEKAWFAVKSHQDEWIQKLNAFNQDLDKLSEKIFSGKTLLFIKTFKSFHLGEISLIDYLQFITKNYPQTLSKTKQLKKLSELQEGSSEALDLSKVPLEKARLLKALRLKATQVEFSPVLLLEKEKSPNKELDFFKALFYLAQFYPDTLTETPHQNLLHYFEDLKEIQATQPKLLMQEFDSVEQTVLETLKLDPIQRELWSINELSVLIQKLFELKLTPEEFQTLQKLTKLKVSDTFSFVRIAVSLQAILDESKEAEAFYANALKREEVLTQNSLAKINQYADSVFVIITGGFHADELSRKLNGKGFTVVKVSPRFTPEKEEVREAKYEKMIRQRTFLAPDPKSQH